MVARLFACITSTGRGCQCERKCWPNLILRLGSVAESSTESIYPVDGFPLCLPSSVVVPSSFPKMPPKADINKAGWEQSEFPILCETCASSHIACFFLTSRLSQKGLGDNPFIRMVRALFFGCASTTIADTLLKVQARVRTRMRDLRASFHSLPLEPRRRHAI